jgi:transposase
MRTPKQYDEQLRQQAIDMALEGSKSIAQVARDLDIKTNTLYGWVDQYRRANPDKVPAQSNADKPVDYEAENRKLKRQLTHAKEDIELLKKAAAYFAANK